MCHDFSEGPKSFGTNSTSLIHKSYAASSKHPRQRTVARKNSSQKFLSAKSLRRDIFLTDVRKRPKDKSDAPQGRSETCRENPLSSKKRKKLHSVRLPLCGFCQPHPQKSLRNGSLWWTPEQACFWSAGKTLPLPNWKP